MKYIQYLNGILKDRLQTDGPLVLFGQNIDAGSCLSGLTRGLSVANSGLTLNTPNSENTLVGVGFGMMLKGVNCAFFMKQQDFLLLGIDHLVNTYNVIRQDQPAASFTIFPVIVDSGYEGPQSALNNFNDFCSIARVDGYSFTNRADTETIIGKYLVRPGFRILGVSQRLLKHDVLDLEVVAADSEARYFQYTKGKDLAIICFNFALSYGYVLTERLSNRGLSPSLFSINTYSPFDFTPIVDKIRQTRNLVLIDDTKSGNRLSDKFIGEVRTSCKLNEFVAITRQLSTDWFYPRHDQLEIDYDAIVDRLVASVSTIK